MDINFQRPKYGQAVFVPKAPTKQTFKNQESNLTDDEINSLREIAPNFAIFTCLDVKQQVPLPLTPYEVLSDLDGIENVDVIQLLSQSLNSESIKRLSDMTVKQSKSKLWKKHRKGRITGSKMHNIFTLKESTSREHSVKSILGLTPDVKTPAMLYGINNEDIARAKYSRYQLEFHDDFRCEITGLMLNAKYPHLGSSPNGIVECSCCGKGCLEIKCLAKYSDGLPGPLLPDDAQLTNNEPYVPVEPIFSIKDSTYSTDRRKFRAIVTCICGVRVNQEALQSECIVMIYLINDYVTNLQRNILHMWYRSYCQIVRVVQ